MNSKFESAKERIVTASLNKAAEYLLSRYGKATLLGEPTVELTSQNAPISNAVEFSGTIKIKADTGLIEPIVGVNMSINNNDIEVTSEENIQSKITDAINSAENQPESVVASLEDFKLEFNGSKYLSVRHAALADASIGIVGKAEFETSKDKAALLKSIVNDAFPQTKIEFTGEFKEPVVEKIARGCDQCEATMINGVFCHETGCPNQRRERFQREQEDMEMESSIVKAEESWLTDTEPPMAGAEFMEYQCPVCMESFEDYDLGQHDKSCPGSPEVMHDEKLAISIKEDMPMARASDHLAQSIQAEEQQITAANEKIKTEAVNALVSMLKSQGYGTAKVAEVSMIENKIDAMVTLDDAGTVKAVNIPVEIKAGKVTLPKKSLVAELISKGLDLNAKLAENFSQEVLNKIAEAEAKAQYEAQEALDIIAEKVIKTAGDEPSSQYFGTNEIVYLNKHLIPENIVDLEVGDTIHIDGAGYRLVSKTKDALSKGSNDGSTWVFEKVTAISK